MDRIPIDPKLLAEMTDPTPDAPHGRTITGHAIGGVYVSSYWHNTYKVLGPAVEDGCMPNGVKVEQIGGGPSNAAHSTPGDVWTHSTQVGSDKLLRIEKPAPALSGIDGLPQRMAAPSGPDAPPLGR